MIKIDLFDNYSLMPFRLMDAASIAKHANNKNVWINLRDAFPFPYKESDAIEFFAILNGTDEKKMLGIFCGGEAIGGIGLSFGTDVERYSAELGYWLGEKYWNQGILSSGIKEFCKFAFNEFNLNRIFAKPFSNNSASTRVLEKNNFSYEGTLARSVYKNGRVLDQRIYALLKP